MVPGTNKFYLPQRFICTRIMEDERNKKKQSEMQHGQLKDWRIFIAVLLFMNSIKRGCLFEDNKEASRYINR